jgi:hypothetical protein
MSSRTAQAFSELVALDPATQPDPTATEFDQARLLGRVLASSRSNADHGHAHVRTSRGRHVVTVSLSICAVIALIVAVVALALSPSGRSNQAVHSHLPTPTAATWKLTADLTGAQFQLATNNPSGVLGVTCNGDASCFLSTGTSGTFTGSGGIFDSSDGGRTWQPSTIPTDIVATTLVSCATANWCAAGAARLDASTGDPAAGKPSSDPVLLFTTNAGASWTSVAVPIPVDVQQLPAYGSLPAETTTWPGHVNSISCSAPGVCNVVGENQTNQPAAIIPNELVFLHTDDNGAHWSSTVLPEQSSELTDSLSQGMNPNSVSMACPKPRNCVIVASLNGTFLPNTSVVDVWRTDDGGTTWRETRVPGVAWISSLITCPDTSDCFMISGELNPPQLTSYPVGALLHSTDGGASWSLLHPPDYEPPGGPTPVLEWQSISCTSGTACFLSGSGITQTTDGGQTWTPETLPPQVIEVLQISCTLEQSCIALGNPSLPFSPNNEGSQILTSSPSTAISP